MEAEKMLHFLILALLSWGTTGNMNSRPYVIANGEASSSGQEFSTEYTGQYFEVYSPIMRTLYSQVHWTMEDPVPIPEDVVQRFENGKVMAIVGYEADQVRLLDDGTEASVPITWAYNHHYQAWLIQRSEHLDQEIEENFRNHSYPWGSEDPYPRSAYFSEGNGGEFRSSFHGYPNGYAQLVESPTHFRFNPMQIDSWNRTYMKSTTFHPGPLPKSSRIPHSAGYSGLIECPCSNRLAKLWSMSYSIKDCEGGDIENSTECVKAARAVVASNKYNLIANNEATTGKECSILQHRNGTVDVLWNVARNALIESDHDKEVVAFAGSFVNITVALDETTATIHMTGPPDRWFGVGFGSATMCIHQISDECPEGGPYAVVVSGKDAQVVERKLDQHGPGHVLQSSIIIKSNQVVNGNRTVILIRPLEGLTDEHYSFDTRTTFPIISAVGCDMEFSQHCGHGSSYLIFFAVNKKTAVCRSGIKGTIGGEAFGNKRCADTPISDLKVQGNPTCQIQTYQGGLSCCRHRQSLLDEEQDIPWPDQYLEYRFKFRFYFEEYESSIEPVQSPPSHQNLLRLYWTTEAFAGEYDIPKCSTSTPPDQCVHVITSRFKVRDSVSFPKGTDMDAVEGIKIIYAGPHCHAPTCLSMELYNADTGQLLCHVEPIHSKSEDDRLYYETGFIAIPPCLFSETEDDGLRMAQLLPLDTTLLSIKRNNSTLPHTGEMASWQMRGVVVVTSDKESSETRTAVLREVKEATLRDDASPSGLRAAVEPAQ